MNHPYRWVILTIIWSSHTIYFLNYMALGTLAPLIKPELGLSSTRIGLLSSAISIGSMVIQIPVGMMTDRFGAKWVMTAGLLLIGLSTISIAMLHSYALIFMCLVLLGAGIGGNQTPGSKAIIIWFPPKGRATGMGIKQTGISAGGLLASVLLPPLALGFHSWRYAFVFAGIVAVGFAAIMFFTYRDPEQTPYEDDQGILGRHSADILRLLKSKDFLLLCLSGIFLMTTQFATAAYLVLYTSTVLGITLSKSGSLLGLSFFCGALGRVGWSLASDYLFTGRRNITLGLVGLAGVLPPLGLVALQTSGSLALIYLSTIFLGFTAWGWTAVYLTRVGEIAGKALAGTATAISFLICNIGAIMGPFIFGYIVDATGGYTVAWFFIGFCMSMVAILSILQRKEEPIAEVQYG
ncbi:MAG: Hexuronate transporter [Syntrophorhabdus sp. PtaU1.Bin058]|nr:MAG: Hexuronate transporter [Syntrophorhabdus sp. PtaU1.Bin058]